MDEKEKILKHIDAALEKTDRNLPLSKQLAAVVNTAQQTLAGNAPLRPRARKITRDEGRQIDRLMRIIDETAGPDPSFKDRKKSKDAALQFLDAAEKAARQPKPKPKPKRKSKKPRGESDNFSAPPRNRFGI